MRYLLVMLLCMRMAAAATVSMNLGTMRLAEALRVVADEAHLNVLISPDVKGITSLHMNNVQPDILFESLLTANHLGKMKIGNIWYVASHDSLVKAQQESRQLQTQSWLIQYASAEDIVKLIQTQLQAVTQVSFDVRTNMIVMRDTAQHIAIAGKLIHKLDVPVRQVQIETRLASVDIDAEQQLGIEFATRQSESNEQFATQPVEPGRIVFSIARLTDNSQLDIALAALEQNGKAELISRPSLFASSQQEASIEAGEEVPYQEVSRSGGTAVAFKKAVLGLKVKPQVLPGNKVLLRLQINQDRPASRMIGGVPAISTRQIKTSALLKDGETVVLGGIYEVNQEKVRTSVPFLGNIPLIGLLFTHNVVRKNKRELLIFVTPRIKTL